MRKHGGTPSRPDKHVTLAAISPPGVARGRSVGGQQSGVAGSKPPPVFTRGTSSCSSQGRRQGEPWGASPRPSAPTYLPTWVLTPSNPNAGTRLSLLDASAAYTSSEVGHPGKQRYPSRACRLPASGSSLHTPAVPSHTPRAGLHGHLWTWHLQLAPLGQSDPLPRHSIRTQNPRSNMYPRSIICCIFFSVPPKRTRTRSVSCSLTTARSRVQL